MAQRKSLGKKLRFNVFKRDAFTCQYCGSKPPSVVLEVDHIHPVSQGGDDSIDNLITACFDCNRGKSSGLLSAVPQGLEDRAEQLREKHEQIKAYERLLKSIKRKEEANIDKVEEVFRNYFPGFIFSATFRDSVRGFLEKLVVTEVEAAMQKACIKINDRSQAVKYFCGICWNMIKRNADA